MGFQAEITGKGEVNVGEVLRKVLPEDLMKFGLIPEFIGRVPVVVSLDELDKEALMRILQEPRNAVIKQYQKLFEMDGVSLTFEKDAVEEIADLTMKRRTGARGLRAIMEHAMRDIMFEIPSDDTISTCRITKAVIDGEAQPECTYSAKAQAKEETA